MYVYTEPDGRISATTELSEYVGGSYFQFDFPEDFDFEKVFDYESNPTTWKYEGTKPAIVDFYATWCRPCKMVAPILEELAEEYGDSIVIYKVDTDRQQELASAFGIRSIPSLLFIPVQGQPQMVQGAMGKADFRKIIDSVLLGKE